MKKIILRIEGMSCSACSNGLEKYLNKQEGVVKASVNLVLQQAFIEYDDCLSLNDLNRFVSDAGFKSLGVYCEEGDVKQDNSKFYLLLYGILACLVLYISMAHMVGLPVISYLNMMDYPIHYSVVLFLLTIPFLIYGRDIFQKGIKNLLHKSPNMDTLVSLGVASSFLYSVFGMIMIFLGRDTYVDNLYFESAAIILFFIKLGRYIDGKSKEKTKEAIKELVQITPNKALIKTKNGEKEVSIDEVKKGDILLAKPGMKIAVDGIIVNGETHLDEAFITGESLPVKKMVGSKVIAGSINHDGFIEYQAERIGKDSTISEIVRLVMEAANTKAPIARLADKVSGYFVPGIIVIAFITFIGYLLVGYPFQESLSAFVTVLVVACPCALGLATPLAIVVSEGLCAKHGILVKTSEILENAHKVDTIVFDKTGTLTYGNLKISKIFNYSNYSNNDLIERVASLESKSSHPIGASFTDYVEKHKLKIIEVLDFKNIPGLGLKGKIHHKEYYIGNSKIISKLKIGNLYIRDEEELLQLGNSLVYVIEDKKIIALIGVKDIVRDNAEKAITKLKELGKDVIMLTGDHERVANIIAESIGIKTVIANVLPQDKTMVIKELIRNNKKVMMVGDGINDAPSLATADIGVSVNSGTDIAADSADVILMQDNLEKIPAFIEISKKTIRNIKQNLFWAFFYNVCMIPLAIGFLKPLGITMNPMVAGFAMTVSSLTVVLNSLRLKSWKEK